MSNNKRIVHKLQERKPILDWNEGSYNWEIDWGVEENDRRLEQKLNRKMAQWSLPSHQKAKLLTRTR